MNVRDRLCSGLRVPEFPGLPASGPWIRLGTVIVARELLGKSLVRVIDGVPRVGMIVETEAYVSEHDLACHASRGRTPRTEVMFGPPDFAYIYLIYGMHYCLNVVTEPVGHASAVLLRALEPIAQIRGKTNGPALLCKALGIDRRLNGYDMTSRDFFVADPGNGQPISIIRRPRIGIQYAGEWASKSLRFYIRGNPYVSKK